jgi:hypothetical protein
VVKSCDNCTGEVGAEEISNEGENESAGVTLYGLCCRVEGMVGDAADVSSRGTGDESTFLSLGGCWHLLRWRRYRREGRYGVSRKRVGYCGQTVVEGKCERRCT